MDLTEKTVSSEQVFSGALLHVNQDKVRLPDNGVAIREWIGHPGAAAVVPVFDNGDTLLVRQYRYAARREFLEVPAGKLDVAGEEPRDVAARELEEETGYKASDLIHLGSFYPCIGYSDEIIHFFLGRGLTKGQRNLSDGEFIEIERLPLDEAIANARSGDFGDMKTVVALLKAAAALGV